MADCKSFISAGIAGAVCALGFGFAALPPFAQELSLDGPNAFRLHREGLNSSEIAHFNYGRGLFHHVWEPVVHDDGTVSGFGPLYNANACAACHVRDGRGQPPRPGDATSFVMRLSVGTREVAGFKHVLPDPVYGYQLQDHAIQGLYPEGRILVTYREFEMALADGQTVRLQRPEYALADPAYGPFDAALKLGPRVAPPVIGLGLLERIPVRRLEALADAFDRDGDGISGRINWSPVDADGQRVPNRFGWKLTAASVREQSEMAANADMGISSPGANRFAGDCTRAQSVCMNMVRPEHFGKDVELDGNEMHLLAFYAANLGVPPRRNIGAPQVVSGESLFADIGCAACHVPTHELEDGTRIAPYTDLLLHDMGPGLADEIEVGVASASEWRTAPLWGIGLTQQVSGHTRFLHDGRARNLIEAIMWHDGEARTSRQSFAGLARAEREALLAFLNSL